MTFTEPMIVTFDLSVGNSPLSIPSDRTILFYGVPSFVRECDTIIIDELPPFNSSFEAEV